MQKRYLIIRFSAIGDIVLTSPVIRSLHLHVPEAEIHYLTKAQHVPLLAHNPHIHQVHALSDDWAETIETLKTLAFDHVFDLHHNLRTWRVKRALNRPSTSFDKKNKDKWLLCQPLLRRFAKPIPHIVERYGATLRGIDLPLDNAGLELFLPPHLAAWADAEIAAKLTMKPALAVVLGATYPTKRWITDRFPEVINTYGKSVILLGGPDAVQDVTEIIPHLTVPYLNAVGTYGLLEAAALMRTCTEVISHDTGFMHIAAAFDQRLITLWGNTVPEMGMTPYKTTFEVVETHQLTCRPCSKIGHQACPKKHFRCMNEIRAQDVIQQLNP